MAQAAPAQPAPPAQQILEQAMQRNELAKLPVWFGDKTKDAFLANDWWDRFEGAAATAQWNWEQIQNYFRSALRSKALAWWNTTRKSYAIANIDDIRQRFLDDYGHSATARTSIAHLRLAQEKTQCVRDYRSAVQLVIDQLELSVDPIPQLAVDEIFINAPNAIDIANLGVGYARGHYRRLVMIGYNRLYQPLFRNLFIDGLLPHLRDKVIEQNPLTVNDAYALARKAEKEHELKTKINSGAPLVQKDVLELEAAALNRNRGPRTTPKPKTRPPAPGRPVVTCYYCQKKGHLQKDCFKRQRENGAMKPPPKRSVHGVDEQEGQSPEDTPEPPEQEDIEETYVYLNSVDSLNW
jgi:hypothetical protein